MFKKILLYFRTIKYIPLMQMGYYVYYVARRKVGAGKLPGTHSFGKAHELIVTKRMEAKVAYSGSPHTFSFLNRVVSFPEKIDWDYSSYGKLWTYQLNYFDFLGQPGLPVSTKLELMEDFLLQAPNLKTGFEPYCISLRNVNWIFFLAENKIRNERIEAFVGCQYQLLMKNVEYHLMANHLFENGISLMVGAHFFRDKKLQDIGTKILTEELPRQILEDGAHIERSPMYHYILTKSVLDLLNVMTSNPFSESDGLFERKIRKYAADMLGWLIQIDIDDSIPAFHDATNSVYGSTSKLVSYAKSLKVQPVLSTWKSSGYRKFESGKYVLIMDVGEATPDYQPGHYHAGIFNFVLFVNRKPVIVDTGISTYENNARRLYERGTEAHNTVQIDQGNQSEVWSSFRLARRARVQLVNEDQKNVQARHNGYSRLGIIDEVQVTNNGQLSITHRLIALKTDFKGSRSQLFHIHFHPSVQNVRITDHMIELPGNIRMKLEGAVAIQEEKYSFAEDFNLLQPAIRLKIELIDFCKISFIEESIT